MEVSLWEIVFLFTVPGPCLHHFMWKCLLHYLSLSFFLALFLSLSICQWNLHQQTDNFSSAKNLYLALAVSCLCFWAKQWPQPWPKHWQQRCIYDSWKKWIIQLQLGNWSACKHICLTEYCTSPYLTHTDLYQFFYVTYAEEADAVSYSIFPVICKLGPGQNSDETLNSSYEQSSTCSCACKHTSCVCLLFLNRKVSSLNHGRHSRGWKEQHVAPEPL